MQVLIDIPESARPGITAAREARNSGLPAQVQTGAEEDGTPIMAPNPDLIASDEDYITWVVGRAVDSYNANVGTPAPAPAPDPAVINGVPQEVPKWKALIGLGRDGLKDQALAFIATLSDEAQALWEACTTVQRSSPLFEAAKAQLGWTDAFIDDMFVRYAQLTLADVTG